VTDYPMGTTYPSNSTAEPVDINAEQAWPVLPLSKPVAEARMARVDPWQERGQSFFRDLATVADAEKRTSDVMRSGAIVRGNLMPPPASATVERAGGLKGAISRLSEAGRAAELAGLRLKPEQRAMTTASGSGIAFIPGNGPPVDVASLFADAARAKAPLANALVQGELPPFGTTVQVGRASTGATVTVQAAEANAPSSTDEVTLFASSPLATIAGEVTISRQLLDRGINVDSEIAASLGNSFGAVLEAQTINGSGASGQILGLLGVSGITADTYVSGAPTAVAAYGRVQQLLADVATAFGAPADTLVMHSRRARWINDLNPGATVLLKPSYAANLIETMGMPVTLGGGGEDAILALVIGETPIFISPPRFLVMPDRGSTNLQVVIQAYAYVALVGARQPTSIGKLTGSGLAAPSTW
jgi:HK97 family phage major capsid protein